MSEKIKINEAVIVEGKYDKIKLSNILDAFIVETNGFSVFKDSEKISFIKKLADERGIIVLTDSDHAGFMIRNKIASAVGKCNNTRHVYIPDIYGKEKRKKSPSKEGKLGVEGMSAEILKNAFEKAGITCKTYENPDPVTYFDLYEARLSGCDNAKVNRKKFLEKTQLPEFLSTAALLSCINNMMSRNEFFSLVETISAENF